MLLNKITSAQEMSKIERQEYAQGASEVRFMEEAGRCVAQKAEELLKLYNLTSIVVLVGKGNNGGDACVASLHLLNKKIPLKAYITAPHANLSPLCKKYAEKFSKEGQLEEIKSIDTMTFPENSLIIDGLLGTGFKGSLEGLLKEIVQKVNKSNHPVLAIDIPSGINGTTGEIGSVAIKATFTQFLGLAKTGCFLEPAWNNVGHFSVYNFGLSDEAINNASADYILITQELLLPYFPKRARNIHKYKAGYVVALAGSIGMPGAAILSCYAALKSGAGIVRLLHPYGMESELSSAPYELIRQGYHFSDDLKSTLDKAGSVLIGPGVGKSDDMIDFLKKVVFSIIRPLVIDAEALAIFREEKIKPPKGAVLTPHLGEMKKILKSAPENQAEFLKACQRYAYDNEIILVVKGSPTFIFDRHHIPHLSVRGDPGMATAGSGDVLTGIIASFLAQGLQPFEAAMIAVYLHGVSGELAAGINTSHSMIASDIIYHLPDAFTEFCDTLYTTQ